LTFGGSDSVPVECSHLAEGALHLIEGTQDPRILRVEFADILESVEPEYASAIKMHVNAISRQIARLDGSGTPSWSSVALHLRALVRSWLNSQRPIIATESLKSSIERIILAARDEG